MRKLFKTVPYSSFFFMLNEADLSKKEIFTIYILVPSLLFLLHFILMTTTRNAALLTSTLKDLKNVTVPTPILESSKHVTIK